MPPQTDAPPLHPNGHEQYEDESQEQIESAFKDLSALVGKEGTSMVTLSKQDMSLLKHILTAASEEYKEQIMWRLCDFIDEDEGMDHVNAYFEAKDLGMSTDYNIAITFSLVSSNRKTNKSNLMAQIMDTVQHGKWAPNFSKGKSNGHNPRSPIG